jgi:hypothetical protein
MVCIFVKSFNSNVLLVNLLKQFLGVTNTASIQLAIPRLLLRTFNLSVTTLVWWNVLCFLLVPYTTPSSLTVLRVNWCSRCVVLCRQPSTRALPSQRRRANTSWDVGDFGARESTRERLRTG